MGLCFSFIVITLNILLVISRQQRGSTNMSTNIQDDWYLTRGKEVWSLWVIFWEFLTVHSLLVDLRYNICVEVRVCDNFPHRITRLMEECIFPFNALSTHLNEAGKSSSYYCLLPKFWIELPLTRTGISRLKALLLTIVEKLRKMFLIKTFLLPF